MKIPSDVTIKITDKENVYAEQEILDRVRASSEYSTRVWCSDNSFRLLLVDGCALASGHFTRTVKTRRVAWNLPEGFEIPADTKVMLEKLILSIADWRFGAQSVNDPWCIYQYDGAHGRAVNSACQFEMRFRVTESTEEIPWSPFEVQK